MINNGPENDQYYDKGQPASDLVPDLISNTGGINL